MDQINQDMRAAEKSLEGMEKCCGLCVLPWKRSMTVPLFDKCKGVKCKGVNLPSVFNVYFFHFSHYRIF